MNPQRQLHLVYSGHLTLGAHNDVPEPGKSRLLVIDAADTEILGSGPLGQLIQGRRAPLGRAGEGGEEEE